MVEQKVDGTMVVTIPYEIFCIAKYAFVVFG